MIKKIEFSKLILIAVYITAVAFSITAAYLTFQGSDVSSFGPIVLAIWAQLGTSSAAYYWKARAENKIKLLKSVPTELAEQAKELLDERE